MELKSKRSRRTVLKKTSAIIEWVNVFLGNILLPGGYSRYGIRETIRKALNSW